MKNKKIISLLLCLALVVVILSFCTGSSSKITIDTENDSMSLQLLKNNPIELKVYVENSGSMDGYMCAGSNLKDAVFDYVSDLSKISNSSSLYYVNSHIIPCRQSLKTYIQNLTPESFSKAGGNRANTDLRQIIEVILQGQKNNVVSVFVSDCILDISSDAGAADYFGNCQVSVKNSFAAALKRNPNLGVQIARLQSKFSGYWYCGHNVEKLPDAKRPYYIWVVGDKRNLARINKVAPMQEIIGGIQDYCAFSTPDDIPSKMVKNTYIVNHTNKVEAQVLTYMGCSLQDEASLTKITNYSLANPSRTKIKSIQRITQPDSKYSHVLNLELSDPKMLKSEDISFNPPSLPLWVKEANDDTGQDVKKNINKTTGILYLVNGVAEAYKGLSPYGTIKLKIKNRGTAGFSVN